ncbi:hypothetical protein [Polyangium sp. 15x6]|uniref:hypothetical protein n=1 Tax=Polyangium sp. 15x6 TaxID=3042687 RepID=UPI00249B9BC6|nr:hypothetical protein [Polyangium sp. 15x6]MDI3285156.1 hypothetical protein [Polyangium sp. 15x6]
MTKPVEVFDDDYSRVTNALREVLSGLPAARRRRLIGEIGLSLLQQLIEREKVG